MKRLNLNKLTISEELEPSRPLEPLKLFEPPLEPLKLLEPPLEPLKLLDPPLEPLKLLKPPLEPLKLLEPPLEPLKLLEPLETVEIRRRLLEPLESVGIEPISVPYTAKTGDCFNTQKKFFSIITLLAL